MIIRDLVEGLKSVAVKSLTSPEPRRIISVSMILMGGIATVSFILAEIFLGFAIYKLLHYDYEYSEGLAALITVLLYIGQLTISTLIISSHIKKLASESIIVKEYKLLKGIANALIEGYKSK
jgi:hypothetical protein